MDTPFIYDTYITGKFFIGHSRELAMLKDAVRSGENTLIYEPPKSGKKSLVYQACAELESEGASFTLCRIDLTNVRDRETFLLTFASELIKSFGCQPEEAASLPDSIFEGPAGKISDDDAFSILMLPEMLAEKYGRKVVIFFEEFQSLLHLDNYDEAFGILETIWPEQKRCMYLITGSMVNAMKYIFEEEKYFHRFARRLKMDSPDAKELTEYMVRGFQKGGKVLERPLAEEIIRLFGGNCWYINHLLSLCDSLSRGYINSNTVSDAIRMMLSVHRPRFLNMVSGMTNHQLSLLKAILEGVTRFSSTDIIERYRLNSSANVKRVKDALKKKEIITFDEDDVPHVTDPLFRYWMKEYFFKL